MKRWLKFGAVAIILLLPVLLFVNLVHAQTVQTGNNATVPQGKVIEGTLFSAGNTVDIAGQVNGDVFCAGQSVTVSGVVKGDLICAGQTVHISGTVEGDVRLAGQTITISGKVVHNATLAGQTVTLDSASSVGDDLMTAGNSTIVNGQVGRDFGTSSREVTVNNIIGRNIHGRVEGLTLDSNAKVKGEVVFTSYSDARVSPGAQTGQVTRQQPQTPQHRRRVTPYAATVFGVIYIWLAMLAIALALVLLFPQVLHGVTQKAIDRPGKTALVGLLVAFATPVVLVSLALTIVGIPLAMFVFLVWLVAFLLSGPVSAYYLGRLILRRSTQPVVIMLLGSVVLLALYSLPLLCILFMGAASVMGLGMMMSTLWHHLPKPNYNLVSKTNKKK